LRRLAEAFDGGACNPDVRAVVLIGKGSSFCTGLDLKIVPILGDPTRRGCPMLSTAHFAPAMAARCRSSARSTGI
jgi:enoyl-CoA hydratase/carnithine racemase